MQWRCVWLSLLVVVLALRDNPKEEGRKRSDRPMTKLEEFEAKLNGLSQLKDPVQDDSNQNNGIPKIYRTRPFRYSCF